MSEQIQRDEIALLAYYAWERDGRPAGNDVQYWLEAEAQIRATRELLLKEANRKLAGTSQSKTPDQRRTAGRSPDRVSAADR